MTVDQTEFMKEIDVWYLHYYNSALKLKGIVLYDTEPQAKKAMELLEKWETFTCMSVVGPRKHCVD